jgi:hypothetical protein
MKKLIFIIGIILCYYSSQGQIPAMGCQTIDTTTTGSKTSNCSMSSVAFGKYNDQYNSDLSIWKPNTTDNVKTIKVNFIIVQKSTGNGGPANFSQNGTCPGGGMTDVDFLNSLITNVNTLYANFLDPSDKG